MYITVTKQRSLCSDFPMFLGQFFFNKCNTWCIVTFNNGMVSDDSPRCFGVAMDELCSVGDRVGVSSTDSLALLTCLTSRKQHVNQ